MVERLVQVEQVVQVVVELTVVMPVELELLTKGLLVELVQENLRMQELVEVELELLGVVVRLVRLELVEME